MRNDIYELGPDTMMSESRVSVSCGAALPPSAVDAAFGDDSAPIVTQRGPRRGVLATMPSRDAARVTIDEAHPTSPAPPTDSIGVESNLLRQLSRQLNLLEIQQQQIRRLLEQTERRAGLSSNSLLFR